MASASGKKLDKVTCKDPGTKLPSKGPLVLHLVLHLLRSVRFFAFSLLAVGLRNPHAGWTPPPKRPCLRPNQRYLLAKGLRLPESGRWAPAFGGRSGWDWTGLQRVKWQAIR